MGERMFDNYIFDQWLDGKAKKAFEKLGGDEVTSEDMLVLTLKAQSNHFHHLDIEFRDEFKRIDEQFKKVDEQFKKVDEKFKKIDEKFEKMDSGIRSEFKRVDEKFEKVDEKFERLESKFDKRFDRLTTILMWGFGMIFTMYAGILAKLFTI